MDNIEHLVVMKRNRMASILEVMNIKQDSDQRVLSYISKLKSLGSKGGGGRGLSRLDLTVGRFFFLSFGKMSSGWETVEIN